MRREISHRRDYFLSLFLLYMHESLILNLYAPFQTVIVCFFFKAIARVLPKNTREKMFPRSILLAFVVELYVVYVFKTKNT